MVAGGELKPFERGLVKTAVRALGEDAPRWLSVYGEPLADQAARLLAEPTRPSLEALPGDLLVDVIQRLGRRRLAEALVTAPRESAARAAARLPAAELSRLHQEIAALRTSPPNRATVRLARRAVLEAAEQEDALPLAFRLGARWLAAVLGEEARRLAARLPPTWGAYLLEASRRPSTADERRAGLTTLAKLLNELS